MNAPSAPPTIPKRILFIYCPSDAGRGLPAAWLRSDSPPRPMASSSLRGRAVALLSRALYARSRQDVDLDVAESHAVAMVLQDDQAGVVLGEFRPLLELGALDAVLEILGTDGVFGHFDAVQPMLDVVMIDLEERVVELADRLGDVLAGSDQAEQSGGGLQRRLAVRIVQQLIFRTAQIGMIAGPFGHVIH